MASGTTPAWERWLEAGRDRLAAAFLSGQYTVCRNIARDLMDTPEFANLDTASGNRQTTAFTLALADQEQIAADTETVRNQRPLVLVVPIAAITAVLLLEAGQAVWADLRVLADAALSPADSVAAHWHWADAVRASGLGVPDLVAGTACLAYWCWRWFRFAGRVTLAAVRAARRWRAALTELIAERLRAAYHQLINSAEQRVLTLQTARGLGGGAAQALLIRREMRRVETLAQHLGAGAIAISGGRGVGKTTLLSMLGSADRSGPLLVGVAAPVHYDARDFLLHLYAELARAVLRRSGVPPRRRWVARLRVLAVRSGTAVLLAAAGAAILGVLSPAFAGWLATGRPAPTAPVVLLLLAVTLLRVSLRGGPPRLVRDHSLAAEAVRRLEQTRFLQTLSMEHQAALARGVLQLGSRRSRQLAEQPLTLPEIVASYREFAGLVAAGRPGAPEATRLVIAIDEIDRIVDADLAERFLNEIKSIFGVPGCVYVVSVSEEALANLERRVLRVRTAFDSAFDEVVRLNPLNANDSVELLRRRLTGVPDSFLVLCHCLAGGMPRDVVRAARRMIDLRAEHNRPLSLPDLTRRLVHEEVTSVRRGFLQDAQNRDVDAELLARIHLDPEWPGTDPDGIRTAAAALPDLRPVAVALHFYATVLEIFTERPGTVDEWAILLRRPARLEPPAPPMRAAASLPPEEFASWLAAAVGVPESALPPGSLVELDLLCSVHRLLTLHPAAAMTLLTSVRDRLGLPATTGPATGHGEPGTGPGGPAGGFDAPGDDPSAPDDDPGGPVSATGAPADRDRPAPVVAARAPVGADRSSERAGAGGDQGDADREEAEGEDRGAGPEQGDQRAGAPRITAEHAEEEAGRDEDRGAEDSDVGVGPRAGDVAGGEQQRADQTERDQHAGVGVPGSEERPLQVVGGVAAGDDAQHERTAERDGDDGEDGGAGDDQRNRRHGG
ncbi:MULTISPECIES: P-loop NTPase fold protein [Catenuloplanes]|uniref:KAP NTPase domain-containing protein n=1 Tax=Catenuloplanes niger TaxID=587534 RepID=A0AAE4CYV3_9ACTN|nr:P-loop NTPase fold protein [Catenuloplanes niger]MDR7326279.1 hypothetical protein [Catenuloplanes niger]